MSEENADISARQWPFFPKAPLDRRFDVQVRRLEASPGSEPHALAIRSNQITKPVPVKVTENAYVTDTDTL